MRKKVLLGCTMLLLVAIVAGGTVAQMTNGERTTNVITLGSVAITLNNTDEQGKIFADNTLEVMPGVSTVKNVSVTNTEAEAWVRVKVTATITKGSQTLDNEFTVNGVKTPVFDLGYDANGKWQQKAGEPDTYYYTDMVPTNGTTEQLFHQVKFHENLTNEYQGCTLTLKLDAEGIQWRNNNDVNNNTSAAGVADDVFNAWPVAP